MQSQSSDPIASYPYQPGDRVLLFDLVRARKPENRADYPGLDDLGELLALEEVYEFIRLWKDAGGRLAGYALLHCGETYATLNLETAREIPLAGLGPGMLDWAERAFQDSYRGQAGGIGLIISASRGELIALLEGRGYLRQPEEVLHMARSLRQPIPLPGLTAGYTIRPLAGRAEAPAWVELHRAAFGTRNMTLDYKLAMLDLPDYDPDLDLVAQAPDGSLAAYVVCSFNREENELSGQAVGYADPVGTHPLHQRRGLCRALLLSGLALLKQRGMTEARLSTGSENTAMQQAARSAGYEIAGRRFYYEKPLAKRMG